MKKIKPSEIPKIKFNTNQSFNRMYALQKLIERLPDLEESVAPSVDTIGHFYKYWNEIRYADDKGYICFEKILKDCCVSMKQMIDYINQNEETKNA